MNTVVVYALVLMLLACHDPAKEKPDLASPQQVTKQVGNVSFIFPSTGFAVDNRNKLSEECIEAIKSNSALIKLPGYTNNITVQFLRSREEMKLHTGMPASGIANVESKILYVVASGDPNDVRPPIRHELMHMMSMSTWGDPGRGSSWMNEGLATYADNNCNGYSVEAIYRYLQQENKLIPVADLTTNFYKQPEMIAYHHAAYIVQYLLTNYGIEKFKALWKEGFDQFKTIYGVSFQQEQVKMDRTARKHFPVAPAIDWNSFQKGCL